MNRGGARAASHSVDPAEIARFAAHGRRLVGSARASLRPLHQFNPMRLGFIRDRIARAFRPRPAADCAARRPPPARHRLRRRPASPSRWRGSARRVTGIDAGASATSPSPGPRRARAASRSTTASPTAEDAGRAPASASTSCWRSRWSSTSPIATPSSPRCGAPGRRRAALLIVATLNRTPQAFALAIVGAEYVLGWLPRGTHDWRKLRPPVGACRRPAPAAGLTLTPSSPGSPTTRSPTAGGCRPRSRRQLHVRRRATDAAGRPRLSRRARGSQGMRPTSIPSSASSLACSRSPRRRCRASRSRRSGSCALPRRTAAPT